MCEARLDQQSSRGHTVFGSVCVCVNSAPQAWLQQKLVVSDLYITALSSEADSTVAFKQTPCLKTVYQLAFTCIILVF